MISIDTSSEFGARVARRLEQDPVGWLTTVNKKQSPVPSTIWFYWDGDTLMIYSQRDVPKVRNIHANPNVSFNLNGDATGGDLIILQGTAEIASDAPACKDLPGYVAKYAASLERNNWTWDWFAGEYSVPIRVTPTSLRGH